MNFTITNEFFKSLMKFHIQSLVVIIDRFLLVTYGKSNTSLPYISDKEILFYDYFFIFSSFTFSLKSGMRNIRIFSFYCSRRTKKISSIVLMGFTWVWHLYSPSLNDECDKTV